MSNIAIEFSHVGKQYELGRVGTGTLGHDLNRWWQTTVLRREDPYLKVGEVNDRAQKGDSDFVWALRDISFKVEQGDVFGIIGKNGAGKSTLLKLLSHITSPTTGKIDYWGRIASLLEVGTGFHPEMTGRENIYMNGTIMGMTRPEIDSKLDEIVDFAGVERYLDTPVKRFSSGMKVRLGFAVAAFLEPEILVVDEVLTVGDAEFQKKALGKMQDVSQGSGRTVLFVSHNMAAVRSLCNNGIVLKNGCLDYLGTAEACVDYYLESNIKELRNHATAEELTHDKKCQRELEYLEIHMLNDVSKISNEEPLVIEATIRKNLSSLKSCQMGVIARGSSDDIVWACYSPEIDITAQGETFRLRISIPHHNTPLGRYSLNLNLSRYDYMSIIRDYDIVYGALSMDVTFVDAARQQPFVIWPFKGGTSIQDAGIEII